MSTPNPIEDMVRNAIGDAITETVRKVIREELANYRCPLADPIPPEKTE